jgi:hypothetical protein
MYIKVRDQTGMKRGENSTLNLIHMNTEWSKLHIFANWGCVWSEEFTNCTLWNVKAVPSQITPKVSL